MSVRQIDSHEATVKTATVEIKTLTVNGKQITLAVFRQLIDEDVIDDETGALRGVLWGKVNYFWNGCHDPDTSDIPWHRRPKQHVHVVWQHGSELRRAAIWDQRYARAMRQEAADADAHEHRLSQIAGVVISIAALTRDWLPKDVETAAVKDELSIRFSEVDHAVSIPLKAWAQGAGYHADTPLRAWLKLPRGDREARSFREWNDTSDEWRARRERAYEKARTALEADILKRAAALDITADTLDGIDEQARAALRSTEANRLAAVREGVALDDAWRVQWAALDDLDQLFIAV